MTGAATGGAAPYYASPSGDVVLHRGDARAVLRALPAGSVHTVITSPPYFALRDYQTATWEGGDAGCDHVETWNLKRDSPGGFHHSTTRGEQPATKSSVIQYRAVCGKCGARRVDAQIGLEPDPESYVAALVAVFREVWRVLRDDGTLWLNLGDSYAAHGRMVTDAPPTKDLAAASARYKNGPSAGRVTGFPRKGLMMIPSRVAIALQEDGWLLRAMIPWLKRSAMPESATDRPTTATEYVFLLSKAANYHYDADATRIRTGNELSWEEYQERTAPGAAFRGPERANGVQVVHAGSNKHDGGRSHPAGRNRRNADWWFDSLRVILAGATGLLADEDGAPLALPVNPAAYPGAHFATFAPKLVEPMLLASTSARGCCPACGAPWVRVVEDTPDYAALKAERGRWGHEAGDDLLAFGRRERGSKGAASGAELAALGETKVTTGWRAGCACADPGDPVPAVVLDPFAGACTTGLVARKHGRHSVLIELSETYCAMARDRLGQMALPLGPLT